MKNSSELSSSKLQHSLKQINTFSNNNNSDPQLKSINQVSIRELREQNHQTQNTIKAIKSKINYMKSKQERTVKKVMNVRRKLNSLDDVRQKVKQLREKSIEQKKKYEESLQKKSLINKFNKDQISYNKKIVMTLLHHRLQQQIKTRKQKKQQNAMITQLQKQCITQNNIMKANKIRAEHVQAHQKRKLYFLQKLKQFKDFRHRKLQQQIRQRQRQQNLIIQMQQRQKFLLDRLAFSQKFRLKCQQQYDDVKQRYQSFYKAIKTRTPSKYYSPHQSRAEIFIS